MSLPRGSHSNCGSQPSGWEPFFFLRNSYVFPPAESLAILLISHRLGSRKPAHVTRFFLGSANL